MMHSMPLILFGKARARAAGEQNSVDKLLKVAIGDLGIFVAAADDLTLFGKFDAATHGSGGSRESARLVGPPPRPSDPPRP